MFLDCRPIDLPLLVSSGVLAQLPHDLDAAQYHAEAWVHHLNLPFHGWDPLLLVEVPVDYAGGVVRPERNVPIALDNVEGHREHLPILPVEFHIPRRIQIETMRSCLLIPVFLQL